MNIKNEKDVKDLKVNTYYYLVRVDVYVGKVLDIDI